MTTADPSCWSPWASFQALLLLSLSRLQRPIRILWLGICAHGHVTDCKRSVDLSSVAHRSTLIEPQSSRKGCEESWTCPPWKSPCVPDFLQSCIGSSSSRNVVAHGDDGSWPPPHHRERAHECHCESAHHGHAELCWCARPMESFRQAGATALVAPSSLLRLENVRCAVGRAAPRC